jgi:predicted  nucleic acid-binding Zn-ribbon protein
MGFVVLHIEKPKGNDARTSAHIERKVHPANADQSRKHLNQRLVEYPAGVENRTQAITHRIETAGITRKIGTNQVRALRVMLSASPEDMERIIAAERFDEWCTDSLKWVQDTFGADNVVSATLHRDEQTPHIHATVVPIVSGERRKKPSNKPTDPNKRTYRKRPANAVRLCADDVMTRDNLELFQDTYAEAMAKYGLQRGIRGSEARHIATPQYYRDMYVKGEGLRDEIVNLEEMKDTRQQEVAELDWQERQARTRTEQATAEKQQAETELAGKQSELQKVKGELKTEKFKSSAAEAGTKFTNTVGSLLGSSKIERQQQEIDNLNAENAELKMQVGNKDTQIRNLHRDHSSEIERLTQTHDRGMAAKQKEIDRIVTWFPDILQMAETADYCREVGFSETQTVEMLMRNPVQYTGKLRSPKSGRSYDADGVIACIERRQNSPCFTLTINGTPILQWFKQQFEKLRQSIQPQQNRGRGI